MKTIEIEELKRQAGEYAAEMVGDGMVVGLGSGSTARYATLHIAQRLRTGSLRDIVAVPTSEATADLARREGIPLTSLNGYPQVDITIDGADEVTPSLDLIKGLGGCLLREKIVAFATKHEMIIVDERKLVTKLGTRAPVPVEVIQFGWQSTQRALAATGASCSLRLAGRQPFISDDGHYVVDCRYGGGIDDPSSLAQAINAIPGAVEHGLFLSLAQTVVVASSKGIRSIERENHDR